MEPMGRMGGTPQEIAEAAAWLCSPQPRSSRGKPCPSTAGLSRGGRRNNAGPLADATSLQECRCHPVAKLWPSPVRIGRDAQDCFVSSGEYPGGRPAVDGPRFDPAGYGTGRRAAGATGWTVEASFEQRGFASFRGLSGGSATDVWAVGENTNSGAAAGIGFAVHFDGTVWVPAMPNPDSLFTTRTMTDVVVMPEDGSAWIVAHGAGLRFDGTSWTVAPELAGAVAIAARDDVMYAVGTDGLVLRWTAATGWTVDRASAPAPAIPAP